ncbi:MAG TPA: fibronectin type III domain-containing protein [Candidatus Dormibacteraeota bacterium]|nr:fibronectin type III domain-containing protein [Candidatus Dormibacteraeota bacterium]
MGCLAALALVTTNLFSASAQPLPGTSCNLFPASSIFNTDISSLPVNAKSATWMSNMTQNANLHPDFGTFAQEYGIPINVAPPPTTPTHLTPTFLYDSESDHPAEGYPIDQSTLIEGGPGAPSGSDRHALVEDKNLCKLYEIYNLQNFTNGQTPSAGSGAVWDLTSNNMRTNGFTSADAAGLPMAPLLLRPDEILAGSITHAIRFTTHCTANSYIWPASHNAGSCSSSFPPMGARFRLKSAFNISGFAANTQVVLNAFKHYGLLLADNGSDWYFQGTTDDWWGTTAGNALVADLKTIPANQFEAVDESGLNGTAGSYAATPPPAPGAPVAVGGEASANVYWTAPATGITSYTVTASPGGANAVVGGGSLSATVNGLTDGTAYTFTVSAANSIGSGPASPASNAVVPGRGAYVPLVPARILDTRSSSPLGPGQTLNVTITGHGGVPASGVIAVVLNTTVTGTTAASSLTVWPAGVPRPTTSNLNWTAGKTVPNLVVVALGTGGQVSIFNPSGSTQVVLDVEGYFAAPTVSPPAAGLYNGIVPNRIMDTRIGLGAAKAQLCAGQTITLQVSGTPNVPSSGVAAVILNVTVTNTVVSPSALIVWPAGAPQPLASNLNFVVGQTVPNRVIVKLGAGGGVNFYNYSGHADVVVDVVGWFTDGSVPLGGSRFVGVTPARILDTRNSSSLGPGGTLVLPVAGHGGVPSMGSGVPPTAVILNVTVTNPSTASSLTVWPDGSARPTTSDLNFVRGLTVPNLVVEKLGPSGSIDIFNPSGTVDVVVDVVGWFG